MYFRVNQNKTVWEFELRTAYNFFFKHISRIENVKGFSLKAVFPLPLFLRKVRGN